MNEDNHYSESEDGELFLWKAAEMEPDQINNGPVEGEVKGVDYWDESPF